MKRYLELVWAILAILTVFAYLLGYLKIISTFFVAVLLGTTFIKGQLVIDYFMGLKDVRLRYRIIPTLWLSIIITLIGVAYYLPIAPSQ
jgi:cytochrome c oxidase subunit IV